MLIGLCGHAGVGKDTVAEYLVREHGYTRMAFADILKEFAIKLAPVLKGDGHMFRTLGDLLHAYTAHGETPLQGLEAAKREKPCVRKDLIALGMGAREVFGEDFWVDQLAHRYYAGYSSNVVITDVSSANEAAFLSEENGVLWEVRRPGFTEMRLPMDLPEAQVVVNNEGGLDALHFAVNAALDMSEELLWAPEDSDDVGDVASSGGCCGGCSR